MGTATFAIASHEPGHPGLRKLAEKTVETHVNHPDGEVFYTYKAVEGDPGQTFVVFSHESEAEAKKAKPNLVVEKHGEDTFNELLDQARPGVSSVKGRKIVHNTYGPDASEPAPFLALINVKYDPNKVEEVRKHGRALQEAGGHVRHHVVSHPDIKGHFVVALPVDSPAAVEEGGMFGKEVSGKTAELLKAFIGSVDGFDMSLLRYVPEFSNPRGKY